MDLQGYLASIRSDGLAFASAVDTDIDRPVPSCPGWDVRDLTGHLGGVHRFWNQIAGRQLLDPEDAGPEEDPPGDDDLLVWFDDGLAALLATLTSADPDTPVWSWISEDPVPTAWIYRRMAQETAVHRWDAQDAADARAPIATDVAVDGIDEFLFQFAGLDLTALAVGGETVAFEATDTGDAWVARVANGMLDVRPADRAASLVPIEGWARGSASDLLLLMWRRLRLDALDVTGDAAALARFLVRAHLD